MPVRRAITPSRIVSMSCCEPAYGGTVPLPLPCNHAAVFVCASLGPLVSVVTPTKFR